MLSMIQVKLKRAERKTEEWKKKKKSPAVPVSQRVRKRDQTVFQSGSNKSLCSDSEASGFDWQQLTVDSRGTLLRLRPGVFHKTTQSFFIAMCGIELTLSKWIEFVLTANDTYKKKQ